MPKFEPQPREKPASAKRDNIVLGVRMDVSALLSKIAKERNITKQDLIRQMIQHCLAEMNHPTSTDTSVPPTKRKYRRAAKTKTDTPAQTN
jgi:hypothetical protein